MRDGDGGDTLHHVISLNDILVILWPHFLFSYFDFGTNTCPCISFEINTFADVLY